MLAAKLVGIARAFAIVIALVCLVRAIAGPIAVLVAPAVQVRVPVDPFWPTLPAGAQIDGPTARYVGGGFTFADLSVEGLSLAARSWLAGEQLVASLAVVVIASALALVCTRMIDGREVARTLYRAVTASAVTVLVGGVVSSVSGQIGSNLASRELLMQTGASWNENVPFDIYSVVGSVQDGWSLNIEAWPFAVGLALFALAAAIRHVAGDPVGSALGLRGIQRFV
jgi:hypothetical protein